MAIPVYKRKVQTAPTSDTILKTVHNYVAGAQTVGVKKYAFVMPEAGVYLTTKATVGTAPTGATLILDVKKNGTTLYTTQARRPTIAISGTASTETATADVTALAKGDIISFDVAQIGSTVAGSDLSVAITYAAKDWS